MKQVVVDCNGTCHAARFTTGPLDNGVIFGFLSRVINVAETYSTNRFLFAWDARKSYRRLRFPEYKAKRKEKVLTEKEQQELLACYEQMNLLRKEILPRIGFKNNFHQNGCEGDDLIAEITTGGNRIHQEFLIIAADRDLYQLLRDGVVMLAKHTVYNENALMKEYGVTPAQWVDVKAIAGCRTDEVPGVEGVAEKTAAKFLLGKLKETSKAYQGITCRRGQHIRKFNDELVRLPHPRTRPIEIQDDELDFDAFLEVCREYGIRSFLGERRDEWQRFFTGYGRIKR